ncbi:histidine phosphatase family protein [Asticcacaulis sp. BYS171W]|uniref:Histidine phosphatase family protein n=1 Tax=Asticcacaulis aquaticus TaxID=2984212 RepID=A0ABT5HPV5_9CAUL|nr:histidine phosphatase family protein [Asticcacaulis aquaticus]MDC7682098.1 histidine phosphatase family protein [Asticcacaulis aquaticus]
MFYVLRHGQTDWNAQMRLQGSTDIPLNETGRDQARMAAFFLADQGITQILASPLVRAHETATIVAETLNVPVVTDARLTERHFGLFEGLTIDEVETQRRDMLAHMNPDLDIDGKHYPHNAERLPVVIDRVKAAIEDHCGSGETCLFVCHGIPFRAIARIYLGEMYSSPNACPVRYEKTGEVWTMTGLDPDNQPLHGAFFKGPTTMGRI